MDPTPSAAPNPPPAPESEDFYMDGPYLVFTAAFHLKRGFCCNSGCRHCPYRSEDAPPEAPCDDPPSAG